jgi:hypothetical protein
LGWYGIANNETTFNPIQLISGNNNTNNGRIFRSTDFGVTYSSVFTNNGSNFLFAQFDSNNYDNSNPKTIEQAFVRTYDKNGNLIGKFLFDITKMDGDSFNSFYLDFESNQATNRYLTSLRNSGLASDALLTLMFGDVVNIMKSNKYALEGEVEKISIRLFSKLLVEMPSFPIEDYVPDYPLTTGDGSPKVVYAKELVNGQYKFYLATMLSGNTYTYFDTDRQSIINDFFVNYT